MLTSDTQERPWYNNNYVGPIWTDIYTYVTGDLGMTCCMSSLPYP